MEIPNWTRTYAKKTQLSKENVMLSSFYSTKLDNEQNTFFHHHNIIGLLQQITMWYNIRHDGRHYGSHVLGRKNKENSSLTRWNLFDLEAVAFFCPPEWYTIHTILRAEVVTLYHVAVCCERPIFTSTLKVVKKLTWVHNSYCDSVLTTCLYQTSWNPRIKMIS